MAKILAVDDKPDNLELLTQILEDEGHTVVQAVNGLEAIARATEEDPDLILLDVQMPEMDGYQACEKLKQREETKNIPIIFLTANTGEEHVVKGLTLGAHDYVTKPFNERELLARMGVMLRIRAAEKKVEAAAYHDALTGLYNRHYLENQFRAEISRAKRDTTAIAIIMFDIDFFKKFNDTFGHDAGDHVLKEVGSLIRKSLRGYDLVVRYGGEEFLALLPATDTEGARIAAEKLRKAVEAYPIMWQDKKLQVTISVGVFCCPGGMQVEGAEAKYIKCADTALYEAKEKGRNQVVVFSGEPDLSKKA